MWRGTYVHTHACTRMHACNTCACTIKCLHQQAHTYMRCMHTWKHSHTQAHAFSFLHPRGSSVDMLAYRDTHTFTRTFLSAYTNTYIHIIYTSAYTQALIAHMSAYTNTYIHFCIHTGPGIFQADQLCAAHDDRHGCGCGGICIGLCCEFRGEKDCDGCLSLN